LRNLLTQQAADERTRVIVNMLRRKWSSFGVLDRQSVNTLLTTIRCFVRLEISHLLD